MLQRYAVYIPALLVLAACGSDNSSKEPLITADSAAVVIDSAVESLSGKVDLVISDIPFPFEILDRLHSSKVPFDQKKMNDLNSVAKYSQYNSKALNLGVYGADLAYVVTYEQFQQIGSYVKNAKKLAEDLHIPFAFNKEMLDKYSKFKDNKDSLTQVVYDSYNAVDKTLKGDQRVGIAALVVTGSWLEGLYLSTQTAGNAPAGEEKAELYKTIGAQRQSLTIVIKLLSEYKDDAYIAQLIKDLEEIAPAQNNEVKSGSMSTDQMIITEKVEKLRNRIVEGL